MRQGFRAESGVDGTGTNYATRASAASRRGLALKASCAGIVPSFTTLGVGSRAPGRPAANRCGYAGADLTVSIEKALWVRCRLMVDCSPRLCGHSRAERDDRDHAAENFFQGGSPKQATPFPRQDLLTAKNRFTPNFRGWGLDENLKPKSPPYREAHIDVRWQDKNEVGPRPAPPCCAPAPVPPSCIAIAMRSMQPLFPLRLCKKCA